MTTYVDAMPANTQDPIAAGTNRLAEIITEFANGTAGGLTPVPGLAVGRMTSTAELTSYIYEPSLCIIVSGSKRVLLGDATYHYGENTFLLTAVGLPTVTQARKASDGTPYISLQLLLDLAVARQLLADLDVARIGAQSGTEAGMTTGPLTEDLLDPVVRLVGLLRRPMDIPVLAAGIHREIVYRLLTGPSGDGLRQIVRSGTQENRSARAIAWLRVNFASRLRIEDLAEESGMAVSTLHHHFKAVTKMSPLQFQKHLRLHEARRLMLVDEADAGTAALQVGYESVSQFNREYRRLFGAPPRRDVKAMLLPVENERAIVPV
ncbi:MAG: AraC family transcriptional regulator [Gemmatimonas sp.]